MKIFIVSLSLFLLSLGNAEGTKFIGVDTNSFKPCESGVVYRSGFILEVWWEKEAGAEQALAPDVLLMCDADIALSYFDSLVDSDLGMFNLLLRPITVFYFEGRMVHNPDSVQYLSKSLDCFKELHQVDPQKVIAEMPAISRAKVDIFYADSIVLEPLYLSKGYVVENNFGSDVSVDIPAYCFYGAKSNVKYLYSLFYPKLTFDQWRRKKGERY